MQIADTDVTVVTEVLLSPEALAITRVMRGDEELKKQVVVVPPATVRDYELRGKEALYSCLHSSHLRFLQQLINAPRKAAQAGGRAGVIAAVVLGDAGEVIAGAGEEHVPGSWLRASTLTGALADLAAQQLGLGAPVRGLLASETMSAVLARFDERTGVAFVDPKEIPYEELDSLLPMLEDVTCASS